MSLTPPVLPTVAKQRALVSSRSSNQDFIGGVYFLSIEASEPEEPLMPVHLEKARTMLAPPPPILLHSNSLDGDDEGNFGKKN